jgi:hypothetical protein
VKVKDDALVVEPGIATAPSAARALAFGDVA